MKAKMSDRSTCSERLSQSPLPEVEDLEGSEDLNFSLIRSVREKPFLYTKTDKRYNDRNLTERAWAQIASDLGLPKDEAKRKWTRLRNNLSKVLARRKAKAPSGSAVFTLHKPWLYEAEMEFLKRHVSQSRTMSSCMNMPSTVSPTASTSTFQTVEVTSQAEVFHIDDIKHEESAHGSETETADMASTDMSKQNTPSSRSPNNSAFDQAMTAYVQTIMAQNEDPLLMWFKGLIPSLRALSPEQLLSFQIKTMQELHRLSFQDQR